MMAAPRDRPSTGKWPYLLLAVGVGGFVASSLWDWSDAVAIGFGAAGFVGILIAAARSQRRSDDGDSGVTTSVDFGDGGGGDGGSDS